MEDNTPDNQEFKLPEHLVRGHKRHTRLMFLMVALALGLLGFLVYTAVSEDTDNELVTGTDSSQLSQTNETEQVSEVASLVSDYLESYELTDEAYGTEVEVVVSGSSRQVTANALPNHETGEFPNSGNPNEISAQNSSYSLPLLPNYTGNADSVRVPGVAINGVKFEPETAEQVVCSSGETYRVEAIQNFLDLGLDQNNAHVQPTGAYHYHGIAEELVNFAGVGSQDLVHVGFAVDGHLMYVSRSGAYQPGYQLATEKRSGTGCTITMKDTTSVTVSGTSPDGTYVSDWQYISGTEFLDECNGTTVDGQYIYVLTNEFPYIPRCLNGEFTEEAPQGGTGGQQGPPPQGGPPQ